MNKKILFYRVCMLMMVIVGAASYIAVTGELHARNTHLQEKLVQANEINRNLETQINESSHYGDYQGNEDFSKIINDNPIDRDYRRELTKLQTSDTSTTLEWEAFEARYTLKWQDEVDAALKHLYPSLNEEDRIKLEQSQKSWQSYMDDDTDFVSDKFIFTRHFGSQGNVQLAAVQLKRTRDRAIELMEYRFSLDRASVDFVYDH
ncbi:lysozyme inhibitor LprI family protein [Saccharibacillus sp. CPCC 101409]|uniref:lysozyme inhibitor LprI family protein n=1 Tax=Saccharibacillus sp. CPCC 101409 TaxID=3058041 RepID=UPI0026713098|nr:lysozyme inhibitor LprI family protein [Saccharibacillus sp. CPCC 101409]MDO3410937.1 lysozyme inhibitor LprI family protein [Saccharibacillus sp. CPCC 101409]